MAKKTHQQYEDELFEKELNFLPLENYIDSKTPILHECINGHKSKIRPDNILRGHSCAKCFGNARKTLDEYNEQLFGRDIKALAYIGHKEAATHECTICGNVWDAKPLDVLNNHGCRVCAYNKHPGGYNSTRFSRDRDLALSPGILYVIVLVNKKTDERTCVKIGITKGTSNKDVLKRAAGFKGYEPRVQKLVQGTLEDVFNLEQELHKKFRLFQYTSEWKFGGHSELFEISKLPEILKSIPKEL